MSNKRTLKFTELNFNAKLALHLMSEKPMSRMELQGALRLSEFGVISMIRKLSDFVIVSGKEKTNGRPRPLYAAKAKWPMPDAAEKGERGQDCYMFAKISKALRDCGPMTRREIADALDEDHSLVSGRLAYWRKAPRRRFRIAEWVYVGGHGGGWTARYAPGSRPDAPKPPADPAANQRRYVEKVKAQVCARQQLRRAGSDPIRVNPFAQLLQISGKREILLEAVPAESVDEVPA